jgi:hypothetical protein
MSAPTSLMHAARERAGTLEQEELLAHCRSLEGQIRQVIRRIEAGKNYDAAWLTHARSHLQIGMMCAVRAITRQDFF